LRGGLQSVSLITESGKLYFQLKQGSFKAPDLVNFLRKMLKKFRKNKLLIIWDGAKTHTSQEVKDFLRNESNGRIYLAKIPPYSPQLNADEQVHAYVKCHWFKNRLLTHIDKLKSMVNDGFLDLAAKPEVVSNFFHHKEVAFYSK
jgi:transposase